MINRVVLTGRTTKDVELRYTPSGAAVSTFTIAVNRQFSNAQGEKEADFINVVCWRQLAELTANYVKKGSRIALEGRLQTRSYDNKEGKKVFVVEVVADSVEFLDSKKTDSPQPQDPFKNEKTVDISDDDLPF